MLLLAAIVCIVKGQEFKVADIFSDNMVLQQRTRTPVWGWAKSGRKISVKTSWNNRTFSTSTDKQGKWQISVPTPDAGGPYQITIEAGTNFTLKNVWIGEVWLASGQSNMSMPLKGYNCEPVLGSTEAILNSRGKNIHFVNVPIIGAYKPLNGFSSKWVEASPLTVSECSAVGWFFADFLNKNMGIPIGIINSSYGGSIVEAWMTPEACGKFTDIKIPESSDRTGEVNNVPTVLFNGMINPIAGYAIKGMIWYQGESNILNVSQYADHVAAMISGWRKMWGLGEFPFYYVQIAPYDYKLWNNFSPLTPQRPEMAPYFREEQMKIMSLVPNSAMAVLMDIGESQSIHPLFKKEVGERLGMLALNKTYGINGFESESPEYERMEIEGNKVIIHFFKQFGGLTSYGKPLELFEIAGENHVFYKAEASLDEEKGIIVVSSKLVNIPKAVRYAFKNDVKGELFGTGGLPVSSFRTDNW